MDPKYVDFLVHLVKEVLFNCSRYKAYTELGTPDAPCNLLVRQQDIALRDAIKERLPAISANLSIESSQGSFSPQLRFVSFFICKSWRDCVDNSKQQHSL